MEDREPYKHYFLTIAKAPQTAGLSHEGLWSVAQEFLFAKNTG
jgi:hypothetical protein